MATTSVSVSLKGLKQTKVLRAMLRLEAFTRKQLAGAVGGDIPFVNGVLTRHKNLYRKVGQVRTSRVGPQEEVLALVQGAEEELLRQLRPLYKELSVEEFGKSAATYVPISMEYHAATELIDSL